MYSVRVPLRLQHYARSASQISIVSPGAHTFSPPGRCIHRVRQLPYNIEQGLGDFLPPAALHMIAIDYQQGLLTRLNEQVKGTEMANQPVVQTVISAASHRRHALAFNYASQALNNSFFLECLKPPAPPPSSNEDSIGNLIEQIRLDFGSLPQLKSTFSAAALGMISSGWVWLVSDEYGNLQVVATFGAGTLLVRSRHHMLDDETNIKKKNKSPVIGEAQYEGPLTRRRPTTDTSMAQPVSGEGPSASSPASGVQRPVPGLSPSTPYRALHVSNRVMQLEQPVNIFSETPPSSISKEPDFDELGDIITPLLCVSVHEHAWVGAGYGVWGKEEYLKQFWTVVDWEAVGKRFDRAQSL